MKGFFSNESEKTQKRGTSLFKSFYFTVIGSSSVKTVANRHRHAAYYHHFLRQQGSTKHTFTVKHTHTCKQNSKVKINLKTYTKIYIIN